MRDLPRAIAISCVIVLLIYVLTIVSFHTTLSKSEVTLHCSHNISHHPFVNVLPIIHFHNSLHGVDHFLAFTSPDIRPPPPRVPIAAKHIFNLGRILQGQKLLHSLISAIFILKHHLPEKIFFPTTFRTRCSHCPQTCPLIQVLGSEAVAMTFSNR